MDTKTEKRFWEKVSKRGPDECWPWMAHRLKAGYGSIRTGRLGVDRSNSLAHRISYEIAHGKIPPHLVVRHSCDTPHCVNPAHLQLGTQLDNVRDMIARGRQNKIRKLRLEDVAEILANPDNLTGVELARRFHVSPACICLTRKGRLHGQ